MTINIPRDEAGSWFDYFLAQCTKRNWNPSGIKELRPDENMGGVAVYNGSGQKVLQIHWQRKRNDVLSTVPDNDEESELDADAIHAFLQHVTNENRRRTGSKFHNQSYLLMKGCRLPGEYWLDADTRLRAAGSTNDGPVIGERVIEVECMSFGADPMDALNKFPQRLKEIAVFLSAIWPVFLRLPEQGDICVINAEGIGSELRRRGYIDTDRVTSMPAMDSRSAAPTFDVERPWFWNPRRDPDGTTFNIPTDTTDLWSRFQALSSQQRKHFLQAATKLYESKYVSKISPTLSFALKFAACEALKPEDKSHDGWNALTVVEHLLGEPAYSRLKDDFFTKEVHGTGNILAIRHDSFHRGKFWADEWELPKFLSSFEDPTFDRAHGFAAEIAREVLVAWLKNPLLLSGVAPPPRKRPRAAKKRVAS